MTAPERDVADIARAVVELVGRARRTIAATDADDEFAPRAELAGAGLGFLSSLLEPLEACRDQVSGDVTALVAQSDEWRSIGDQLRDALAHMGAIADGSDWTGAAATRFTSRISGFDGSVGGAVDACLHLAGLLRTSADLMAGARGLIEDIIDRVVAHMIATEAAAEASSAGTAGASEAVALSSILGAVAEQVEQAIAVVERVDDLLDRIGEALREVAAAFGDVNGLLDRLAAASDAGGRGLTA